MWKKVIIISIILLGIAFLLYQANQKRLLEINEAERLVYQQAQQFYQDYTDLSQAILPGTPLTANPPSGVIVKDFGVPSPYQGQVVIDTLDSEVAPTDPAREYIVLRAREDNPQPISLEGWSIQSMISGIRIPLPDAVEDLVLHEAVPTYYPLVKPGQAVFIHSGASPLGISFQTNLCTGYLNSFQPFYPPLPKQCPPPSTIIPPTIKNVQTLGPQCMAFVQEELEPCQYVSDALAEAYDIPDACQQKLKGIFTYTFCRGMFKDSPRFFEKSQWHLYLNAPRELWLDRYEVIRLLDAQGKTVDVWSVE